jgi:hypothetical protein
MRRIWFIAALAVVFLAAPVRAAEMKDHLDFAAKVEWLKSHFRDYGQDTVKTVFFEPQGLRFWLETTTKDATQSGLYSYFTLAGDFEISADYEWRTVTEPKAGYGVSCGIAVDSEGKTVALARAFVIGKGDVFRVSKKVPGKDWQNEEFPAKAVKGKLVLRRVKAKVTCLASDGDGELEELGDKIPFTGASVRKLRLFADPGNVPNALDARLIDIHVRAEEIKSDIPLRERESNLVWWLTVGSLVFAAVAGYLGYRRWQDDKWLWSRGK